MIACALSLVIPTRNRAQCLTSLIDTLERFQAEGRSDFELIIADNSDTDGLRTRVESSPLPISYLYSSDTLSVVDNFNRTIPLIRGRFACFLGDDDLVSERLFDVVKLMERDGIDTATVSEKTTSIYFWPGVIHARWGDVGARLYLSDSSGQIAAADPRDAVQESDGKICDGPLRLPRAYFGVVATRCIQEAVMRYGELFGGCSPDIYSSRLLATVVRKSISIDLPFIVPGASKSSTSAQRAERSDVGNNLKNNDHTGRFHDLQWSPFVPNFYAPFTVWAQSLLEAKAQTGEATAASAYSYLYAKCLLFCRGHGPQIRDAIGRQATPAATWSLIALASTKIIAAYLAAKLPLLMRGKPGAAEHCFGDLPTSDSATQLLDARLRAVPLHYVR
jgi:glycosyltransferase involved in cell wall biosynthesis